MWMWTVREMNAIHHFLASFPIDLMHSSIPIFFPSLPFEFLGLFFLKVCWMKLPYMVSFGELSKNSTSSTLLRPHRQDMHVILALVGPLRFRIWHRQSIAGTTSPSKQNKTKQKSNFHVLMSSEGCGSCSRSTSNLWPFRIKTWLAQSSFRSWYKASTLSITMRGLKSRVVSSQCVCTC